MRNIAIIAAVLLLAFGAYYWSRMPPANPGNATGSAMVDVTVPELGIMETAGMKAFDANCAACHGANAAGREGAGPPLVHVIYEPSHHGDGSFYLAARNGVRAHHWSFGDMPAQPQVTENEVERIVAYVRALQRASGIN